MNAIQEIEALLALREKATPTHDATLMRYDHGGGRFYREVGRDRSLIADFYNEGDREYYFAAANATEALRKLVAIAKAAEKVADVEILADEYGVTPQAQRELEALDSALQAAKEAK